VVVWAVELVAYALEEVVVAGLLAVEARVVDDPGFLGWGRDKDVEALAVLVEGDETWDGVCG